MPNRSPPNHHAKFSIMAIAVTVSALYRLRRLMIESLVLIYF